MKLTGNLRYLLLDPAVADPLGWAPLPEPPSAISNALNSPPDIPVGRCQPSGQTEPVALSEVVLYVPVPAVAEYQL